VGYGALALAVCFGVMKRPRTKKIQRVERQTGETGGVVRGALSWMRRLAVSAVDSGWCVYES
jgi:hypothetical protein